MRNTSRVIIAATIAAMGIASLAHPASATAALSLISAGDRIDYINPTGPGQFCTIGYTFKGPDLHTYAVTAGHCRNSDTGYARDTQKHSSPATSCAASSIPPVAAEPTTG